MKILIVDNSRLYSKILEQHLPADRYQISYCNSPIRAIELARQEDQDYVCLSNYLIQENGIELCNRIRLISDHYKKIPIILFASHDDKGVYLDAVKKGITDVFFKEEDISELIAHIKRIKKYQSKIRARILFIEDSLLHQELIRSILNSHGLTVFPFTNAEDAFKNFCEYDYDLVITDIVLEGAISGIKLINMIRRLDNAKGDVPILAMSAFDNTARRIDIFARGANDYVNKPIIEEEFMARVRNLINPWKA